VTKSNSLAHVCIRVCVLLSVPALAAWSTAKPLLFPSLGPTAFALALSSNGRDSFRQVLGGHLVGVVAGLLCYHLFATRLTIESIPPAWSLGGLKLVASGVLSVILTTGTMLLTDTSHSPACATTLIVSLGLLPTFVDGGLIMLAVLVMCLIQFFLPQGRND
jgi:HPP family